MPEKLVFSGAGYKIYIWAMFGFGENGLRVLVELIKLNKKTSILCYYTIHGALRMCPKTQFFQGASCKLCIPKKFEY